MFLSVLEVGLESNPRLCAGLCSHMLVPVSSLCSHMTAFGSSLSRQTQTSVKLSPSIPYMVQPLRNSPPNVTGILWECAREKTEPSTPAPRMARPGTAAHAEILLNGSSADVEPPGRVWSVPSLELVTVRRAVIKS